MPPQLPPLEPQDLEVKITLKSPNDLPFLEAVIELLNVKELITKNYQTAAVGTNRGCPIHQGTVGQHHELLEDLIFDWEGFYRRIKTTTARYHEEAFNLYETVLEAQSQACPLEDACFDDVLATIALRKLRDDAPGPNPEKPGDEFLPGIPFTRN